MRESLSRNRSVAEVVEVDEFKVEVLENVVVEKEEEEEETEKEEEEETEKEEDEETEKEEEETEKEDEAATKIRSITKLNARIDGAHRRKQEEEENEHEHPTKIRDLTEPAGRTTTAIRRKKRKRPTKRKRRVKSHDEAADPAATVPIETPSPIISPFVRHLLATQGSSRAVSCSIVLENSAHDGVRRTIVDLLPLEGLPSLRNFVLSSIGPTNGARAVVDVAWSEEEEGGGSKWLREDDDWFAFCRKVRRIVAYVGRGSGW